MAYIEGKSGSFWFQDSNKQFTWRVNWTETYDIELNTSIVGVSIDIKSRVYGGRWWASGIININGEQLCEMNYYNPPTHYVDAKSDDTTWKPITSSVVPLPVYSSPIPHNADGSKSITLGIEKNPAGHNLASIQLYNSTYGAKTFGANQLITIDLTKIPRAATITSAPNFTDAEDDNPTIKFSNAAGNAVDKLEACISLTGARADIAYREITNKLSTSYTFTLTEDEREILRAATNEGSDSRTVYFILQTTIGSNVSRTSLAKTFTVVDANPDISALVMDVNEAAVALTGDRLVYLIKGISNAGFEINGYGKKGADIVYHAATNGGNTIENDTGTFYGVESADFTFTVKDTRGLNTTIPRSLNLIEYVKPTCSVKAAIAMETETSAKATITITGSVFDGSFGAVDNQYMIYVSYTGSSGWESVSAEDITISGTSYKATYSATGLDYTKPFSYQAKITDSLHLDGVLSAVDTIGVYPVFDWSNEDFNFNVPIRLNNNLAMRQTADGKTVLHSNNNDFHIWTTPDNYSAGHFIVKANNGGLVYNNQFLDFVVARGTASMGSNGIWYWEKWQSGRAICYGTRNFGKAAITTAFGSMYKTSTTYSQALPSGLFNNVPIYIGKEVMKATDGTFQVWTDGSGTMLPSKDSTGGFFLTRPTSYTTADSIISFYVVGSWK